MRALMLLVAGGCLAVVAIVASGCEGQALGSNPPPAALAGIPWPPPDGPAREASDDVVVLHGKDFSANGGGTAVSGEGLIFTAGESLPFAVYTVKRFGEGIEVGSVGATFTVTEGTPGDGTALYVGVSNYARGVWEWHEASPINWDFVLTDGTGYRSPTGRVSIAVILSGGGSASLSEVRFARSGPTDFAAPENLTAQASVYFIDLDWDDVAGALGYNLYRALSPDFTNPLKVNSKLLEASDYRDRDLKSNVMYYYRVTAVAGVRESAPSSMLDIFAPVVNLLLPTDCKVTGNGIGTVDVAWTYPETGLVSCFEILVSEVKDFNLEMLTAQYYPGANKRTFTIKYLKYQHTYYWRIVALDPLYRRGRMTDDTSLGETLPPTWTWSPPEIVGWGIEPVALVEAEGELSAAFYGGPHYDEVWFSRRSDEGTWTAGNTGLDETLDPDGFGGYLDMAYGGGQYVAFGFAIAAADLWAAIGVPGSWTLEHVEGDGKTCYEKADRDYTGDFCRAAASDTEFAVVYRALALTFVKTRPAGGGDWTRQGISTGDGFPPSHSIAFDGDDLGVLSMDHSAHELLFGTSAAGYAMSDIAYGGGADIGASNDLMRLGSQWLTPARDETNEKLYVVSGSGSAWTKTEIASDTDQIGAGARMAPRGADSAVIVYWGYTRPIQWHIAVLEDGKWKAYATLVADVGLGYNMDVACLGTDTYILFEDTRDKKIKCCLGTPVSH